MVIYIIYLAAFMAVNLALAVNCVYSKSKKVNCQKVNFEKSFEVLKNFIFVLFPAMIVQMLGYYGAIYSDEVFTVTIIFACIAVIYLADATWLAFKYRNTVALRVAYQCDMEEVSMIDGVIRKKGYMLAPRASARQIIEQINKLPRQKAIKDRRLIGYITAIIIGLIFLLVGVFWEDMLAMFYEMFQ